MDRRSLVIKDLSIRKMPGLSRGLPTFQGLNPQVNLIYGVNGSGKSSTARLISAMIWRMALSELEAEASWMIGSDRWVVRAEGGRARMQKNGVESSLDMLPAVEGANRYMLALDELMIDNAREMAEEILRLSIGGYDLAKASRALKYSSSVERRNAGAFSAFEAAKQRYHEVYTRQEKVKVEERDLPGLLKEKTAAENARVQLEWFKKLAAWLEAKQKADAAGEALAAYPPIMGTLTGKEYSDIEALEKDIQNATLAIAVAESEMSKQGKLVEQTGLPAAGLPPTVLGEAEEIVRLLEEQEKELRVKAAAVEASKAKEQAALNQLGAGKDPSSWSGLMVEDLALVDEQLRRHHLTLSERQALEEMIAALQIQSPGQVLASVDQLNAGVGILSRWLQASSDSGIAPWLPWALSVTGIATAVAVEFAGVWGFVGIGLLVVALMLGMRRRTNDGIELQDEYGRLGLEMPAAWDKAGVITVMDGLVKQLKESVWQDELRVKMDLYQRELKNLGPKLEELRAGRVRLEAKLGLLPGAPLPSELKTFDTLYWFLKQVSEWALLHRERVGVETEWESLDSTMQETLKKLNVLVEPYGLGAASDGPSARTRFERLRSLDEDWEDAQLAIREATAKRETNLNTKTELQIRLDAIYTGLQLQDGEKKEKARALVAQKEEYGRGKQHLDQSMGALSTRRAELEQHPLFGVKQGELESLPLDQVRELMQVSTKKAEGLAVVSTKISEINGRIQLLRQSDDLEIALTNKMAAEDGLMDLYESNLSAVTGQLILNSLTKTLSDENQPVVYRRAKEIFSRVTHGRYSLIPPVAGEVAAFRADDTVQGWGHSLNELSTGTRVQLLLSVRLAFVEEQEQGVRLPLLADELLATTDEHRAEAVIETLAEFCREGRQLFYFTAQKEEVEKWHRYLADKPDLSYTLWELDGQANEVVRFVPTGASIPPLSFQRDIPEPAGRSHEEYGRLLQVEGFDLMNSEPIALPLWYLIDDPEMVYKLYRKRIQHWGELSALLIHNGQPTGWTAEMTTAVRALTELLARYQELYRQGRAWRIDRQVLVESDSISDAFMERVVEVLGNVDGDPRELIRALRSKEVPGFRTASIDDLEKFLLEEGYIDDRESLSEGDINIRLQAYLSGDGVTPEKAERFLARLAAGGFSPAGEGEVTATAK